MSAIKMTLAQDGIEYQFDSDQCDLETVVKSIRARGLDRPSHYVAFAASKITSNGIIVKDRLWGKEEVQESQKKLTQYGVPLIPLKGTDILAFPSTSILADQLIDFLTSLRRDHGNLQTLFASGRGDACNIHCASIEEDPGWEGSPGGKAIYLS